MVKRMLIDATHPEETRVVVVNGTRLEELDVETSTKRQLKGNIYLAKVIRVEPSLQAAFVDYGGNRHGFLAFSEIHPDYFQIPVADRQALLAAQKAVVAEATADAHDDADDKPEGDSEGEAAAAEAALAEGGEPAQDDTAQEENGQDEGDKPKRQPVEVLGGDDPSEQELERRRARLLRNYKIQEVIKRRQIMLVQVVKEERGNKGAALTTYLSLAGRYCVLMPNTARGGGVSRKITNATDRRRLKSIATELDCPEGMAVIVRTAGSERSKTEIKRDYEYLLRAWDAVRELTLKSTAPALVYEEASLIKRSIRDLYSRDIDEVLVDGDEGYRLAKDYMRMLTPSHAKKVQPYKDPVMPLFHRFQVESQLDAMHSPVVQLKSGGYIVIGQTEALVAIDVNSGRATKERHIEETALKTNLEAADEIARQLRLRDLAGLIVIDFIDMEENRNNHAVERRLKDALKNDRARIQVGRISAFGLLELSRQRLRPSLQETSFQPCPHCAGTGLVRSVESSAVHVLRAIEEEGTRRRSAEVTVYVHPEIALYILNHKRGALADIEARYQFQVFLAGDDSLIAPNLRMERVKAEGRPDDYRPAAITLDATPTPVVEEEDVAEEEDDDDSAEAQDKTAEAQDQQADGDGNGDRKRRRRRRRKRRGGANGDQPSQIDPASGQDLSASDADGETDAEDADGETDAEDTDGENGAENDAEQQDGNDERRRRRRGRRGGRRRRRGRDGEGDADADVESSNAEAQDKPAPRQPLPSVPGPSLISNPDAVADVFEQAEAAALAEEERRAAAAAAREAVAPVTEQATATATAPVEVEVEVEAPAKPKRVRKTKADTTEAEAEAAEDKPKRIRKAKADSETAEDKPKRTSRAKKADVAEGEEKPKRAPRPKKAKAEEPAETTVPAEAAPIAEASVETQAAPAPAPVAEVEAEPSLTPVEVVEDDSPPPVKSNRRGWWNR